MLVFPAPEMEMKRELSHTIAGPYHIPLSVHSAGSPAVEDVVLHEAFQSSRALYQHMSAFSRQRFVIAFDLPSHGRSGSPLLPDPSLWVERVQSVLTHFQVLHRSLLVVVWSLGGLIMLYLFEDYGVTNLHGLVSVSSFFGRMSTSLSSISSEMKRIISSIATGRAPFTERLSAFEELVSLLTTRALPASVAEALYGSHLRVFLHHLPIVERLLEGGVSTNATFLSQMSVSARNVQGLVDRSVPFVHTRTLAFSLPHPQLLEYEHCGHAPCLEEPEQFNRDVPDFLSLHTLF